MTTETRSTNWMRVAGWAGLGAAAAVVALLVFFADSPTFTDSPGEIRSWIDDHATAALTMVWIEFVADMFLLVPFILGSAALFERAAPHDRLLIRASVIGGLGSIFILWIDNAFVAGAVALGGYKDLSDATLVAFLRADGFLFFFASSIALALWLGAGGLAILRSGVVARWLGWLGIGAAAASVVGGLWIIDGDPEGALTAFVFAGIVAMVVWMVGLSVSMIRGTVSAPAPEMAPAPAAA